MLTWTNQELDDFCEPKRNRDINIKEKTIAIKVKKLLTFLE